MYGEEKRLECWFNSCDVVSLPYLLSSLERDSHGLNSLDFFLQPFRGGIVFSLRAVPSPDVKVTAPLRHLLLLEYLQLSLPEASSSLWFFSFQMWRAWKDLSAGMTFLIEQSCHTINSSTIYSDMLPKVRLCQCWILKLSVSLWVFFLLIASFFFLLLFGNTADPVVLISTCQNRMDFVLPALWQCTKQNWNWTKVLLVSNLSLSPLLQLQWQVNINRFGSVKSIRSFVWNPFSKVIALELMDSND